MLTIAIQAGGESQRMGRDKGLVLMLGQPLVARVAGRLRELADEMIVTTNHPAEYAFLNLPLVPDLLPGRGALGGLYTALSAAAHPLVGVVACDMPFASPALLAAACDLLAGPALDAVIPHPGGHSEPFHAVYRKASCLPLVAAALQAGRLRADAWFPHARLRFLTAAEISAWDPLDLAFLNVNTPADLARAEEIEKKYALSPRPGTVKPVL